MKQPKVSDHLKRLYQEWVIQGNKGVVTARSHAKHIEKAFGKRIATELKADDFRLYITERKETGAKNSTINRELAIIRRALSLAYETDELARMPKIPRLRENNVRQGTYTREEVERLCSFLPPYYAAVVRFGYLTGRRKGEILQLRWVDVDLHQRVLSVQQSSTKTHDVDRIPLEGELFDLIQSLVPTRVEGCPWIFHRQGHQIKGFKEVFKRAKIKAGLPDKLFHDLRRTVATDLIEAGADLKTAMAITGHRTVSTFQRYQIVQTAGIRSAMTKMQEYRQ